KSFLLPDFVARGPDADSGRNDHVGDELIGLESVLALLVSLGNHEELFQRQVAGAARAPDPPLLGVSDPDPGHGPRGYEVRRALGCREWHGNDCRPGERMTSRLFARATHAQSENTSSADVGRGFRRSWLHCVSVGWRHRPRPPRAWDAGAGFAGRRRSGPALP